MTSGDIWRVGLVGAVSTAIFVWGYRQHQKEIRDDPRFQELDAAEREHSATLPERPPSFLARLFERQKPGAP